MGEELGEGMGDGIGEGMRKSERMKGRKRRERENRECMVAGERGNDRDEGRDTMTVMRCGVSDR